MTSRAVFALLAAAILFCEGSARAEGAPRDAACFPACRSGFLCHEGRCVSACNPPCAAGESCTAAGECAPTVPAAPAPLVGEPPRLAESPAAPVVDPGWGRGAFYFGAASAGLDLALTAAVIAKNPVEAETARSLGAWAIAVFGVTAPLTALGGASARGQPGVVGHPRLRMASWVGYGLALADAAMLLSRSRQTRINNGFVLSVGLLGAFSTLGFALDARASAVEAEGLRAASVRAQPALGLATSSAGAAVPLCGWAGTF